MTTYWCQLAWLGGDDVSPGVVLDTSGGQITDVAEGVIMPPPDATTLPGVTVPGFVNAHSHVFHRALRARTHGGKEDFWSWRDAMYDVAATIDPDGLYRLARATYGEMVLAGITTVGEFHYLHHQPDGSAYDDPNAMAEALFAAATDAGIRMTLLDALYLRGGHDEELSPTQRRFSDGSADNWRERIEGLTTSPIRRLGAAIHSVRAVPREEMHRVVGWANDHDASLHAHLSEQPAENDASQREYGQSPTHVFESVGALETRFTAVHATHLDNADIELLANADAACCICPTTERELADGIGPTGHMADAGIALSLGTDAHALIDMSEEMRAVELNQRLATGRRGAHTPAELLDMATASGADGLGWGEVGRLQAGSLADFVTVSLDSVRMAGTDASNALDSLVFAAGAPDVQSVVVDGEVVASDGRHVRIDVVSELNASMEDL